MVSVAKIILEISRLYVSPDGSLVAAFQTELSGPCSEGDEEGELSQNDFQELGNRPSPASDVFAPKHSVTSPCGSFARLVNGYKHASNSRTTLC